MRSMSLMPLHALCWRLALRTNRQLMVRQPSWQRNAKCGSPQPGMFPNSELGLINYAGKYAGWRRPASYLGVFNSMYDLGFVRNGTCIRKSDALDAAVCPPETVKVPAGQNHGRNGQQGLSAMPWTSTCLIRPTLSDMAGVSRQDGRYLRDAGP